MHDLPPLLIAGASGHARVLIDLAGRQGRYRLSGLLDAALAPGTEVLGCPVIGPDEALKPWCEANGLSFLWIGIGDNWRRQQLWEKLKGLVPGLQMGTGVHPSATIGKGVVIGPGTVVMAGAILNAGCHVGEGCIINSGAIVEHDCVLEGFSSVGPGAVLGGGCHIAACSAIGLGARLLHKVKVGAHTVVGAGALLLNDLPGQVIAYGSPARVIRPREKGEAYL